MDKRAAGEPAECEAMMHKARKGDSTRWQGRVAILLLCPIYFWLRAVSPANFYLARLGLFP